jgi:DNA-binding response OmpR family regulator
MNNNSPISTPNSQLQQNRTTVLLVEDNEKLNESNRRALELKGYHVLAALTLHEAREHLKNCDPDIILLDVMLPDGDGIDFCGEIHEIITSHIIFLTAKTEQEDKIRGLDYGGDDYITKPFKLDEMLSRVGAAVRRRGKTPKIHESVTVDAGRLSLNIVSLRAYWQGGDLNLHPKDFLMLKHLMQYRELYFSTEDLYREIWDMDAVDVRVVKQSVYRLRKVFTENGISCSIGYRRGQGYRFALGIDKSDRSEDDG